MDLTVIIPLLDRSNFTKIWLNENIIKDIKYIFADGSKDDNHREIFNNYNNRNVEYIKYPHDKKIGDFINKMSQTSKLIKTKYVVTSDNDDFLNYSGISKCINFLNNNSKYHLASGTTMFVSKVKNKYKFSYNYASSFDLDSLSGVTGIQKYFNPYSSRVNYIWYSVYRSEVFSSIWNEMNDTNIRDGQLNELFQTCIALSNYKYKYLYCNNYIRLVNPGPSYANSFKQSLQVRIIEDENTFNAFQNFVKYFSKKLQINEEKFKSIFYQYFTRIKYRVFNFSIKNFILSKIYLYLLKFINIFKYKISTIRKIINFFYFFNKYIKILK